MYGCYVWVLPLLSSIYSSPEEIITSASQWSSGLGGDSPYWSLWWMQVAERWKGDGLIPSQALWLYTAASFTWGGTKTGGLAARLTSLFIPWGNNNRVYSTTKHSSIEGFSIQRELNKFKSRAITVSVPMIYMHCMHLWKWCIDW